MSTHTMSWVLTDVATETYVENFSITNEDLAIESRQPFSITKRRLRGGMSDGVDLIEVVNGPLRFTICPTRGMGIWRGQFQKWNLGWKSPVHGPVHPNYVNRDELGGIGWLQGFDEWIVRCGLNNNGGPAVDKLLDNTGAEQSMALPLHGRIANIPAHHVAVTVETKAPYTLTVTGIVDESMLFFPQLRLQTEIKTNPGSPSFTLHDRVINLRSQPAEFELLYHCNFGQPLLDEGSKFRAPVKRLAPINDVALKAIDRWNEYPAPTAGIIEECFLMELLGEKEADRTIALLENPAGDKACALRFSLNQLPWFTLWRNPGAISDGYVTGLEPATDFPNAKPFERAKGRVLTLAPGGSYDAELTVELAGSREEVEQLNQEIASIQRQSPIQIDREIPSDWSPAAE